MPLTGFTGNAGSGFTAEQLENRTLLATAPRIVGYFPEYRWGLFNKIDFSKVTHVNYFSVSANNNGSLSTGNISLSHLDSAVAAIHNQHRTISITVGPQSLGPMISAGGLPAFVTNIVQFATAHNLDGIDIDWEPPATGADFARYGTLIDSLYAQTAPLGLFLSAAVNPITHEIPLAATAKLDWINVMGYDFWPANHSTYTDATNALNGWASYGVPKSKLVLGVPFYGRKGTTWSNTQTQTYDAILDTYFANNGSYPSSAVDSADGWFYNGVATIQAKTQYTKDNGYAGVMIWELGQDHFVGANNAYDSMSLLPAIKNVLGETEFASLDGSGNLIVTGDNATDAFSIRERGNNILVALSGNARVFSKASVSSIVVNSFGGSDTLDVNTALSKPLVINGGGGNKTLNVNAGAVTLNADLGLAGDNVTINVAAAASIVFASSQHLAALNLNGAAAAAGNGSRVLVTRALALGAAGRLDLSNNAAIIDYAAASPLAALTTKVIAGRNGGAWDGSTGISSSNAAASPGNGAVGIAEASAALGAQGGTFAGEVVDETAVLLRFTRPGDADLSGTTDIADFSRLAAGFNQPGPWSSGDSNYDGSVDIADFAALAANFNQASARSAGLAPAPRAVASGLFAARTIRDELTLDELIPN